VSAKADIDFTSLMSAVGAFQRNMSDATRALPVIAESLVSHVQDVFEKEGAVGGNPRWPDITDETKLRRRGGKKKKAKVHGPLRRGEKRQKRVVPSGKFTILQDTGVLAASITPAVGGSWVEAYTGVRYAVYHVSKEPRRVIPLRDFFAIDEKSFYADAAETILAVVTKGMR
jgi:phage gpG-like protein